MNLDELYNWNYKMAHEISFSTDQLDEDEILSLYLMGEVKEFDSHEELIKENFENDRVKFSYGEISRSGVDNINNFFIDKKINTKKYNLYDLGSGYGRIILHMSAISNFKSYIGVELAKHRYEQSIKLKELFTNKENVHFINDNFFNIKIKEKSVVVLHAMETYSLVKGTHNFNVSEIIWNSLGKDSYLVTGFSLPNNFKVGEIDVSTDYGTTKKINFYKKSN